MSNSIETITKCATGKTPNIDDVFCKSFTVDLTKTKPTVMTFFKKKRGK